MAMRDERVVSYQHGDQLGSVSVTADASGSLVSRTLYEPWGEVRYTQGTSPTDYGYTGQRQEGDIYFYNARYYDPTIGRFMQADTIVPPTQGTQGFDRFAYVNNNPLKYVDPTGMWLCDQHDPACAENSYETLQFGKMYTKTTGLPFSYTISGSYDFGVGKTQLIDHYSDDVISPTVPLTHPVTWGLQLIDLLVRIYEDVKPSQEYVPKDDLYWLAYVTAFENELEITRMSFWVPEETIGLGTIDFRTPDLIGRGQEESMKFLLVLGAFPLTCVIKQLNH